MDDKISVALLVFGVALVTGGVGAICVPAAAILLGLVMVALAWGLSRSNRPQTRLPDEGQS